MSKTYRRDDNRRPKWGKHSDKKPRKQRESDYGNHKHRPRPVSPDVFEDIVGDLSDS